MRRALLQTLAAALVVAAALISTDCSLDGFCQDGTPGCAADSCKDLVRDGDETDVDCGGTCGTCAPGKRCAVDHDCAPGRCFEGKCCGPPCVAWARRDGSKGDDHAWSAAVLGDQTVIVAGDFQNTVDFGSGPVTSNGANDVYVAALAPGGGLLWLRQFGGAGDEILPRVAVTPDGHIWVAGAFQSPNFDTGAGVLHTPPGTTSLFVVLLDSTGATKAAQALPGGMVYGGVKTLAATSDGGLIFTGQLGSFDFGGGVVLSSPNSFFDIFVAKLDKNLSTVWAFAVGDAGDDWVRDAKLDGAGDSVMTATSTTNTNYGGPPVSKPGLALVKYKGDTGAHVWSHAYGAGLVSFGLAVTPQGSIVLTGDLTGTANFGTGKLVPKGLIDGFVALFDPTPTWKGPPTWVTQVASTSEMYGLNVAPDDAGGLLAAMRLTGTLRFAGGSVSGPTGVDSVLLLGLDAGGHLGWATNAGGVVLDHTAVLLSPGPQGRLLLYGGFAGTLNLGGTLTGAGGSDAFVSELLP